jgi:RNA polymerase sigma-70 factor (ECF subfamily)
MSKLPNLPDASDQEVVTRAREGDEDAYREMLRRYGPPVFELIHGMVGQRELAEDLAQETFVKAFGALDRHDPERKPSAWILRIANNTAIDYVRRKRPDSTRSPLTVTPGQIDQLALRMPTPSDTPTASTDRREFAAALKRALRRLRPEYRRCFNLRHMDCRSYDEIAEIVHLPRGTVKSHVHRAKQELRRMLRPVRPSASADPIRTG